MIKVIVVKRIWVVFGNNFRSYEDFVFESTVSNMVRFLNKFIDILVLVM